MFYSGFMLYLKCIMVNVDHVAHASVPVRLSGGAGVFGVGLGYVSPLQIIIILIMCCSRDPERDLANRIQRGLATLKWSGPGGPPLPIGYSLVVRTSD